MGAGAGAEGERRWEGGGANPTGRGRARIFILIIFPLEPAGIEPPTLLVEGGCPNTTLQMAHGKLKKKLILKLICSP